MPVPTSWAKNIVVGRGYSTDEQDGTMLWDAVMERTALAPVVTKDAANWSIDPIGSAAAITSIALASSKLSSLWLQVGLPMEGASVFLM